MAEPRHHELKDALIRVDPEDPSTWLYRIEADGFSRDFTFAMQAELEARLGQLKSFLLTRDRRASVRQINNFLDAV